MSKQHVFCMVGGTGETSYANNSIMQRKVIEKVKPLLEESIGEVCCNTSQEFLNIADLGCSSGPNALAVLQSIIDVVVSTAQRSGFRIPELNVFLNDLPRNDFNTIFKSLASFYREIEENYGVGSIGCFISGTPGSFYGRLFPCNLMHFMHSSTCLHWLSQAPKGMMGADHGKEALNKGCIYGRKGSLFEVVKAYREQFAEDFAAFLRCRSQEAIHGGRIVLSFVVTQDDEACPLMELTSIALYKLASQGRIDREKLHAFNLPYYRPTIEQVKQLIESEESLSLHKLDTFALSWVEGMRAEQGGNGTHKDVDQISMDTATSITKSIRAMVESLIAGEFGEEIMDDVFGLVQGMVIDNVATGEDMEVLILVVSLKRI